MNNSSVRAPLVLGCCAAFVVCWMLGSAVYAADTSPPENLSAYRGRNRVLLIFAPSAGDTRHKKQETLLQGKGSGLKERDLVRINITGKSGTALRKQYGVSSGDFRVILVGKDGHTAYSSERPVVASDLFGRIDRMPMRRDEMRRRGR